MMVYHLMVIALSAGIALSLPYTASFIARNMLVYWSLIENEKIFLISVEIAVAILLISVFQYAGRIWKDRRLSKMARGADLVLFFPARGRFRQRKIRTLMEKHGTAKDIMVIGSTGFRTFVDPERDLHNVIQRCREAKIMLLNPDSEGARARAKSILHPDVTVESFREQIRKSIGFLKGLRAAQKNVKLKLYSDTPDLKLAILGDYLWMQHYHPGLDIETMPIYVFKHNQNSAGLYQPFYQLFMKRWENCNIPEYDLETDELVYRDSSGNELRRVKVFRDPHPSP